MPEFVVVALKHSVYVPGTSLPVLRIYAAGSTMCLNFTSVNHGEPWTHKHRIFKS